MKRLFKAILLALVAILVVGMPVLATSVAYRATYTIVESAGTPYTMLPVLELADNEWMSANGFFKTTALDTRIETLGGLVKPHMVATNKTLTAVPVPANSQINLYYTTANSDLNSLDIITGYNGYITITDDDTPAQETLEPGSDFEIEQLGYVDTSDPDLFTNLVYKRNAFGVSITDTEEITGIVYFDEPVDVSPAGLGAWADIDASEYIPAYASGVVVRLYTSNVVEEIGVRINGSAQELRGDIHGQIWGMVGVDSDSIFQGWIEAVTCHIYIVGYTGSGVTYKTVADDVSLPGGAGWVDIDLSAEAPSATGVIIGVERTAVGPSGYGLKKKGSADARTETIIGDGFYYGIVGCDGSQIIEGHAAVATTDFYLVGYVTDNFTFNTNGTDKSLAAGFAAWTAIDCSANVPTDTTHIIFEVVAVTRDYGFRRNGSAENIHPEHLAHCWVVVECDEDQVVEMWAEDNTVDCYIIGYTEGYIDSPYEVRATATGIASGEYTVKTYGVANEPVWATGDVLHFTGAATSNVNAGAIHDNIAKLWVSLWFRLDSTFSAASATDQFIWGKYIDATHYVYAYLESDDGKLYYEFDDGGVNPFTLTSTTVSWTANTWYHIITSLSNIGPAQRLLVNGTAQDTDTVVASNTPNGGDFCFGDFDDPGAVTGFIGEIQNVIVGIGNLSVTEEAALYVGIAPTAGANIPTEYWYADEGTGTAIVSYGSVGTEGAADTACTWETSTYTYTTAKSGRLCDFYIEVNDNDGVADADRWGANLKGASVTGNTNDWYLNQNNIMPYMDYYYHTVAEVLHAWYQPNYMVTATDYDGTETAGGSAVTVTDNTMTDAPGYWVNALVTITAAGDAAPEGESRVCTVFAAGGVITVAPAFSANVDIGDTFTVDFGTLIDRSYYGVEFDAVDDIIACGAAADMDITDTATLTAWVYIDSDGENNEGSIIDRRDATPDGYRLYVSSEAAGNVAIEAILDGATDAQAISNVEVSISGWHYIVAVYNRLGTFHWEIYEDSVLLGLTTDQAGVAPITGHTANVMNIGDNAASDRCFDGRIDEPSFYTTAWTQELVTANYNADDGLYTPTDTTSIALQLHMEEGTGAAVADTSGEANNGTITNAVWVNGKVPRLAGNAGTNDSRLTWGANPTGVAVALGGMVSTGQPTPGALPADPARDILLETPVTDWYIEPDVGGTLLTNPLRPFVTMWSDNSTLTEIQCWRIYALAIILLVTVATAISVGRHQGITAIMAGVAILGAVVLTIFPMWALVFAIGMFIGGLVMERAPSL